MPAWLLPALIGGGSALLGGLFGNKKQPKSNFQINPGTPLYDYLKTGMMPASSSGGSSSTSSVGSSTQTRNLLSMPEVSASYKPMEGLLQRIMMQRLNSPSALPAGFETQGILDTNRTFSGIEKAMQNRLASTGTYDSGAQAAAQAYLGGQRGAEISDFRRGIPLQERALRNEDMGLAQALIAAFGRGQRDTGTIREDSTSQSNTSSSQSSGPRFDPSGPLNYMQMLASQGQGRNAFGNLMDMLGMMAGAGMFSGKGK